jgi:hypothetical protein
MCSGDGEASLDVGPSRVRFQDADVCLDEPGDEHALYLLDTRLYQVMSDDEYRLFVNPILLGGGTRFVAG